MSMTRFALALVGLTLAAPALAQDWTPPGQWSSPKSGGAPPANGQEFQALTGKLIQSRCHMDYCGWFSLESVVPAGKTRRGSLYAVASRGWESHHPNGYDKPAPRTGGETSISFVFCSKETPYVIQYYGAGDKDIKSWHVRSLAVGKDDSVFGYNESDFTYYYAVCHNTVVKDPYDQSLARRLGYHVIWTGETTPEDRNTGNPSKVLEWEEH